MTLPSTTEAAAFLGLTDPITARNIDQAWAKALARIPMNDPHFSGREREIHIYRSVLMAQALGLRPNQTEGYGANFLQSFDTPATVKGGEA